MSLKEELTIIPLGGLGEVGMNAMLIAYGKEALLIDCGVLFPDDEMLGIDLVIPDFSIIKEQGYRLLAYLITHGHEDHIGALPYALPIIDAPVYASRFSAALIQGKMREWDIACDLHEVQPRERLRLGPFDIEFIRVTHSIPDGLAIAIRTPLGTLIHTGDFKIDMRPIDGEPTDLARFTDYGEEGVLLLMSDSTNSESEGASLSESAITRNLEHAMASTSGKIFVAAFSSHIHRIQQIVDLSQKLKRKVVLNGRSMVSNVRLARSLGLLTAPDEAFVDMAVARDLPANKITILTTGSQAEESSAIAKMAYANNPALPVMKGDLVIFSSRAIPGNERAISKAINGLIRQGAEVVYGQTTHVHTSGHAHQEEQRLMIHCVKPRYFMPIHGELRHLQRHARTAIECGIDPAHIFEIEDGAQVTFKAVHTTSNITTETLGAITRKLDARKILIDGKSIGETGDIVLRDRKQLAMAGMLICIALFNAQSGELTLPLEIISRGIVHIDTHQALFEQAKALVEADLAALSAEDRVNKSVLETLIRNTLKRFFKKQLARHPIVLPFVILN